VEVAVELEGELDVTVTKKPGPRVQCLTYASGDTQRDTKRGTNTHKADAFKGH
jgi:hypothetical protein